MFLVLLCLEVSIHIPFGVTPISSNLRPLNIPHHRSSRQFNPWGSSYDTKNKEHTIKQSSELSDCLILSKGSANLEFMGMVIFLFNITN